MKVAKAMELPILATAEDYAEGGSNPPMHPTLAALLPAGTHVWNKLVWNLYGQPDIRAAVDAVAEARGVDTFILVGLETDVCVAQSALGLQAGGFRVVVVCVEIKILRRVRAELSRRPPRHRRDACSMAWRCRFLAARSSQDGRVIAEK
jgi:hypothetical protein